MAFAPDDFHRCGISDKPVFVTQIGNQRQAPPISCLPVDAEGALADLKANNERMQAGLAARELEDLKDFIAGLKDDLKRLQGNQENLAGETARSL